MNKPILNGNYTKEELSEFLYSWCNTYERLPVIIEYSNCEEHSKEILFTVIGEFWSSCDNIGLYANQLKQILFVSAERTHLNLMMNEEELKEFNELPEVITIYRGCYENNRLGLSWSLDKKVAQSFPNLHRYKQSGIPLLLTASILRELTVLKNNRTESEIICFDPVVVNQEIISTLV